ncbi:helix-turn-helix domain-containing protein [Nostoc flagelliforme]|uniref:helix-turn-helix domain-containing protein n=1 Tax=Nostoc flagelliforme TaxID=1306274 RepID=UPI00384E0088
MLENLNFSFSVLNKLKLYSTNIISGIGSRNSAPTVSTEKLEGICQALSIKIEDFLGCPLVKLPQKIQNIA